MLFAVNVTFLCGLKTVSRINEKRLFKIFFCYYSDIYTEQITLSLRYSIQLNFTLTVLTLLSSFQSIRKCKEILYLYWTHGNMIAPLCRTLHIMCLLGLQLLPCRLYLLVIFNQNLSVTGLTILKLILQMKRLLCWDVLILMF